jgi:hypothetical protein
VAPSARKPNKALPITMLPAIPATQVVSIQRLWLGSSLLPKGL